MFNTISSNEAVPKGKKVLTQSLEHRQAHFDTKDPGYNNHYQSVNQYFHTPKERIPNMIDTKHITGSQVQLGQAQLTNPKQHYLSETKNQFAQPQNPQKAKQTREKTELLKTTYSLGQESLNYTTSSSSQFYDKSGIQALEMRLKKEERYNIITNKNMPSQMLTNASAFDYWNQDKSKNRTSNNLTDYPTYGLKIDPITNRILPTSKAPYGYM